MEAVARISSGYGHASVPADRGSVAHSGWSAQSGIFLVLLRQRALVALSRQTLSEGLQQASRDRVLDSALRVALSLEFVPGASRGEPARAREAASAVRVEFRRPYADDMPGLVGTDSGVLCDLNQSGVLHL